MFGKKKREREEQERQQRDQEDKEILEEAIKEENEYYESKNYIIVVAADLKSYKIKDKGPGKYGSLESEVQRHIELGWRVHGSVFTVSQEGGYSIRAANAALAGEDYDNRDFYYCQPMVKD